jgi:hypothetical protein
MDSEIKEVVFISISAIILSIVLGFVSVMGIVQRDIAQTRNDEVAGNQSMIQLKEYNKYDKNEICGEEVVECIRLYYDKGITIYVASNAITHHVFNLQDYMTVANQQYYSVKEDGVLLAWFNSSKKYKAYLVYNSEPPLNMYNRMIAKYNLTPASVTGTLQQKYDALDNSAGIPVQNSEITGILIIDSSDL